MGDRVTFVIEQNEGDTPIFIYGHYAGYEMMDTLAKALYHAKDRIDMGDPYYGARMIFCHMVGNDWESEYGWGLSTRFIDTEHSVPVVNIRNKTVRLLDNPGWDGYDTFDINAKPKFEMSVDQFIAKFAKNLVAA